MKRFKSYVAVHATFLLRWPRQDPDTHTTVHAQPAQSPERQKLKLERSDRVPVTAERNENTDAVAVYYFVKYFPN